MEKIALLMIGINVILLVYIVFDGNLSWEEHLKHVQPKASPRLYLFRQIRDFLDTNQSNIVFTSLVQAIMDYAHTILNLKKHSKEFKPKI